MSDDNLGFADEQFWAHPQRENGRIADRLIDEKFAGLRTAAPAIVSAERATLPVVFFHVGSPKDVRLLRLKERAIVTAVDLVTGDVAAGVALTEDNEIPEKPVPPPEKYAAAIDPDPQGTVVASFAFDAFEQLGLTPGKRATFAVNVIAMDRVSNRRVVKVGGSASSYEDEAVEAFLDQERVRVGPPPVSPRAASAGGFPRYDAAALSPRAPEEPGIALKVERVTVLRPGADCILYGTVRAPLAKYQIVPQNRRETAREGGEGGGKPYDAVIPVGLVVTGSDDVGPAVLSMNVPVYEPIDRANPPATVVAHFAVDLLRTGIRKKEQTLFVYAFSRELMSGPTLAAFVSPDRLPR